MKHWSVLPNFHKQKLIDFVYLNIDISSKRKLKSFIEAGLVLVNGKIERFASKQVRSGDRVEMRSYSKNQEACSTSITLLFEDDDLIVINKPSGFESNIEKFESFFSKQLFLVHRLDKNTSGVMLLTKTKQMFEYLKHQFKERSVTKKYIAVVDRALTKDLIEKKSYLTKDSFFEGQTIWASSENKDGKLAHTRIQKMATSDYFSIVECYPITGRTHQIRVHLKELGHPVLGDFQYCRKFCYPEFVERLMLHSYSIEFYYPPLDKKVAYEASFPKVFERFMHQAY